MRTISRQEISASTSRREFIRQGGLAMVPVSLPTALTNFSTYNKMADKNHFDVIIVGGSYSGLAAAMALGRALRKTLVIDSDKPCNRQTPNSHNFLTQDGRAPHEIASIAKQQVAAYII